MKTILIIFALAFAICWPTPGHAADKPYRVETGKVALSTTAALVIPLSNESRVVRIENLDAAIIVFYGPVGVTTANGKRIKAATEIELTTRAAIYMIATSGTPSIDYSIQK